MSTFRIWRWSCLAFIAALATPTARGEMIAMITPDSISNPPSEVGSANGTPVSTSNIVVGQYGGFGLNFNATAITRLNGSSVWTPISVGEGTSSGSINYTSSIGGSFLSPGSSNSMPVSSLSVVIVGQPTSPLPLLSMLVYGLNGQSLNITPLIGFIAGEQDWTFTGAGISSFSVLPSSSQTGAWGVSQVSFTPPATLPEPSSLVLAGLGALGLAARLGCRRNRRIAWPVEE